MIPFYLATGSARRLWAMRSIQALHLTPAAFVVPDTKRRAPPVPVSLVVRLKKIAMQRTFTLTEQSAFGSQYSWRLKDSEIRFRGTGDFQRLVTRRIPASAAQVDEFFSALELLQVWDWRSDYDPGDVGATVEDGSSWSFIACDGERQGRCGGVNAHPSFADHKMTTLDRGRFALLHAALYDCFGIEGYIQQARLFAALPTQRSGEPDAAADGGGM